MNKHTTGLFIAVEGADGVGKSTVLKLLLPKLMEPGRYKGILFFHWKPTKGNLNEGGIPETVPHDPRGSKPRGRLMSFVYLCYHWLSFFVGYFKNIAPALRDGKLVIADRYTYDILLDPLRFRLNLPRWLLCAFVKTLPQPDVVLALTAEPETIFARKHELSVEEIKAYQQKLTSSIIRGLVVVRADADPNSVVADAYAAITVV